MDPRAWRQATRAPCVVAGALLLAGCIAGINLAIGPGGDAPSVNLAATAAGAAPGERIGLVAAPSDDWRAVEVAFCRVDAGGYTLLVRDSAEPYTHETALPAVATGSVRYFARAFDDARQASDSAEVTVTLR